MNWNNISLYQFQRIEQKNAERIDDLDKILFAVCYVFDYTEYQLDNMKPRKVDRLASKISKVFNSPFTPEAVKRFGKYKVEYNPENLTFGQYIELSFFLQMPLTHAAHYILASITHFPFFKNNPDKHKKKADYFLTVPVQKAIGTVTRFTENFNAFNKEYSSLFGINEQISGPVGTDKFNRRYGWIYSATVVAEYERISMEQTFKLPVRQALNDLVYLKEKALYDELQLKKNAR